MLQALLICSIRGVVFFGGWWPRPGVGRRRPTDSRISQVAARGRGRMGGGSWYENGERVGPKNTESAPPPRPPTRAVQVLRCSTVVARREECLCVYKPTARRRSTMRYYITLGIWYEVYMVYVYAMCIYTRVRLIVTMAMRNSLCLRAFNPFAEIRRRCAVSSYIHYYYYYCTVHSYIYIYIRIFPICHAEEGVQYILLYFIYPRTGVVDDRRHD